MGWTGDSTDTDPFPVDSMVDDVGGQLDRLGEICKERKGSVLRCCQATIGCFNDVHGTLIDVKVASAIDQNLFAACGTVGDMVDDVETCVDSELQDCSLANSRKLRPSFNETLTRVQRKVDQHCDGVPPPDDTTTTSTATSSTGRSVGSTTKENTDLTRDTTSQGVTGSSSVSSTSQSVTVPPSTTTAGHLQSTTTLYFDPGGNQSLQTTSLQGHVTDSLSTNDITVIAAATGGCVVLILIVAAIVTIYRRHAERTHSKGKDSKRPTEDNTCSCFFFSKPDREMESEEIYEEIDDKFVDAVYRSSGPAMGSDKQLRSIHVNVCYSQGLEDSIILSTNPPQPGLLPSQRTQPKPPRTNNAAHKRAPSLTPSYPANQQETYDTVTWVKRHFTRDITDTSDSNTHQYGHYDVASWDNYSRLNRAGLQPSAGAVVEEAKDGAKAARQNVAGNVYETIDYSKPVYTTVIGAEVANDSYEEPRSVADGHFYVNAQMAGHS